VGRSAFKSRNGKSSCVIGRARSVLANALRAVIWRRSQIVRESQPVRRSDRGGTLRAGMDASRTLARGSVAVRERRQRRGDGIRE
jgi:hypothetical protein